MNMIMVAIGGFVLTALLWLMFNYLSSFSVKK